MSQFQNEAFPFDFVKCLAVQTLRQSVAMATVSVISFHMQIITNVLFCQNQF